MATLAQVERSAQAAAWKTGEDRYVIWDSEEGVYAIATLLDLDTYYQGIYDQDIISLHAPRE